MPSAHYTNTDASVDEQGRLVSTFKIAGLGDAVSTTVTLTANAHAEYACRNHGGGFPSDPKKQTVEGPVSEAGSFTSAKNGSISASLVAAPPPATMDCPPGQEIVLLSVRYTEVKLSEPTAGEASIPGTFERVFIAL